MAFARSPSGYNNRDIALEWLRRVFDTQTKSRANVRPRILINDGFTAHESLEVLQFCHENNIILYRLPSHASHKLKMGLRLVQHDCHFQQIFCHLSDQAASASL